MSANKKYGASRSSYKSSNKRFSPYKKFKKKQHAKQRSKSRSGKGFSVRLTAPNWSKTHLMPFEKDFYHETPNTSSRSLESIDEWKKTHSIECLEGYKEKWTQTKHSSIKPIMEFADASFPSIIMRAFTRSGFAKPTSIQSATWPILLSGYNVVGIAKTGSGKTLAFLLPAIVHILAQPSIKRGDGPISLIIAPTRELACQIEGEVDKFASNVRHCCVYGGASKQPQENKLSNGVSIVVATPGRLLDFLASNVTNLKRVTYTVIDEADALLDMGFKPQLDKIMAQIRPDRQMLMFSATWPKEVRALATKYMNSGDIYQVAVGCVDKLIACEDVTQRIRFVDEDRRKKEEELKKVVDEYMNGDENCKILVFVGMKWFCNKLMKKLQLYGYGAAAIHGNKKQAARERALSEFKNGTVQILLATDVAARGLHIDDITLVINFDMPVKIEDYVHRIGRTGRAGNKGTAISFFAPEDANLQHKLIQVLEEAKQEIPLALTKKMAKVSVSRTHRNRGKKHFKKRSHTRLRRR
eukprot:62146_1